MNNLKKLRVENNLTVRELADKTTIAYPTISRMENADRPFTQDNLIILCNFFNVSSDYLLGRSDIRNPRMTQFGKYEHEIEALLGDDPNLLQTFKDLMKREECALLFSKVKELDASTIKKVLGIINIIEKEESD